MAMDLVSKVAAIPSAVGSLARLVRFSHSLFALPWALGSAFLAARGWPGWRTLGLVVVAMVAARTAAMACNRLVDRRFDATNPRTAGRPSVTGEVSPTAMVVSILVGALMFVLAAFALNPLSGILAGPTLVILLGYSWTKRFTVAAHFVLGLALGLSPLGAYVAVRGEFDAESIAALALGVAVIFWTAGFDILYACQDVEHDRAEGLHSVPSRFGVAGALAWARAAHVVVPVALLVAGLVAHLGLVYWVAVATTALLLGYEHALVTPKDLSRLDRAFFPVNVAIAFVVAFAIILDTSAVLR